MTMGVFGVTESFLLDVVSFLDAEHSPPDGSTRSRTRMYLPCFALLEIEILANP
jgi:hypothetical protein